MCDDPATGRIAGMPVHVLLGPLALSAARLGKRLVEVQHANPGVTDLQAEYVHFADVEVELEAPGRAVLDRLLAYGPRGEARKLDEIGRASCGKECRSRWSPYH